MAITLDGTSGLTLPGTSTSVQVGSLTSSTSKDTSTGATLYDFTNIPSWVKRITVMVYGVSTSGTSSVCIRPGTVAGIVATGYSSSLTYCSGATATTTSNATGLYILPAAATMTAWGSATLTNISGNKWVWSGVYSGTVSTVTVAMVAGTIDLGDTLTQLRLTTLGGTDTFDAGTVNILYE